MDFTNAQKNAPNPWLRRIGRNQSIISPITFHGLGVLGAMNPCRASTGEEYNYETEQFEEVEGYATCLTEVVDWPFSEDDAGIAFDQSNLWGVRTRVWRLPIADGGGDKDWWTAVPKTLPAAYTAVARCGLMQPPDLIYDWLGDDPMIGFSWNHRTPTGLLLDTATPEGNARSLWTPMNLNQQVIESTISYPVSYSFIDDEDPMTFDAPIALIASSHVGFRGAKVTITVFNPGPTSDPYPQTVERTIRLFCAPITSDSWTILSDPPADMTDLGSFDVSETFAGLASPNVTSEITLGDLKPSADGIPQNFFLYADPIPLTEGEDLHNIDMAFQLSPRTDVPLPYFASQRNRVAPGGIILPA